MFEYDTLKRIQAYVAKNRLKVSLEAEVRHMATEANEIKIYGLGPRIDLELEPPNKL